MEQTIDVKIPRIWMEGLPEEELTLKHIFRLGVNQYKVERAIQLYSDGVGSLGYIADKLGLDKQELIRKTRLQGVEPAFSDKTVQEELA